MVGKKIFMTQWPSAQVVAGGVSLPAPLCCSDMCWPCPPQQVVHTEA